MHDVGFDTEPVFEEGFIAQTIDDLARSSGISVYAAAGNVGSSHVRVPAVATGKGPDNKAGLYGEFKRAEAAFSAYTIAGNPSTGDELPFHIENETRSKEGYLYFLTSYFRTLLWKQAVGRAAPFEDLNEEDDLNRSALYLLNCADRLSIMIHRRGEIAPHLAAKIIIDLRPALARQLLLVIAEPQI